MPLAIRMSITPSLTSQLGLTRGRLDLVRSAVMAQLEEVIMPHIVKRARLNAPILEGDLRESIVYQKPHLVAGEIITGIGSDLPYALRWHEEDFIPGPVSSVQPETVEGGVGKKYIARAVNYWHSKYRDSLRAAVAKSLASGTVVTVPMN